MLPKQLHKHPDITITKADKTNLDIVLNKSDNHSKLRTSLNDKDKFTKLNNNPTNQLKSKINKLINANNTDLHNIKLPKIIGDYKPGYIYRTVKINKPVYPLRPIILQVTTPTYQPTKTINDLISSYLSHNYSIKSITELIEILKTHKPNKGMISYLDGKFIHKCPSSRNNQYNHK